MSIKRNLEILQSKIEKAAIKVGTNPDDIILVAASKYADIEMIMEAKKAGINIFGENKAQDFCQKYKILNGEINWHFIGHLQRNKVKYIVGKVDLIQSLDSYRLALEIDKRANKTGIIQKALVEVNISGEKSKTGIKSQKLEKFISDTSNLANLKVCGLMVMAPYTDDKILIRNIFSKGRIVFDSIKKTVIQNMNFQILSMGMTNDFDIGIEEGSNMIRIGSAIFNK